MQVWTVIVVTAYVAVLSLVAFRARAAHQFQDFSLAGRRLPLPLIFGSLAATLVGPAFSMGFVGKGFHSGFVFLGIGLALAFQNLMVGLWVAPKLRAIPDCHTLGDVMGQKYGRLSQVLAGIISVGLCASFSALMAKAGGEVLKDIFGLPPGRAVIVIVAVTTLYTTVGGLRGSVITDAFQTMVFAIILPLVLVWLVIFKLPGSWTFFAQEAVVATQEGWGKLSAMDLLGLVTAFLLGEALIPPYANRALASRSTAVSRYGFLLTGGFSVVWFVVMCALGISARGFLGQGIDDDAVLIQLVRLTMPAQWYVLLMLVLISIIMSSLDSLLNAGAVSFAEDILKPLWGGSDARLLSMGRVATVIMGVSAAVIAVKVPTIIGGLLVCYSIWAPAILPALLIGLWIRRPQPLAGFLSMATGTLVAVFFQFVMPTLCPSNVQIPGILPSLLAAILAYALGHLVGNGLAEGRNQV